MNWTRWTDVVPMQPADFQSELDRADVWEAVGYLIENDALGVEQPSWFYQPQPPQ